MSVDPVSQPQQQRVSMQNFAHRQLLLAGLCLGFALRVLHLGSQSLWYDETVSAFLARQAIPDLIAHTARDIHPPGYYLLLHLWQSISAPALPPNLEFLFAWPSLFWGMLLLPLIYALGRKLFDRSIGLIALWIAAIHPYHIWYSQEVRMYTLGAALGLICLWAMVKWMDGGQQYQWLAGYTISAAAGLYTLYYFAFLLITLNLMVLTHYALGIRHLTIRPPLAWLAAQVAAILIWLPWLPVFWRQISEPPVPAWRQLEPPWVVLSQGLAALLVGQSPPLGLEWLWAGAAALLLGASFVYAKRRFKQTWILITVYIAGPLVLVYLLSVLATPLYHIRYFFIYAAPVPLLVALGLRCLRRRWLYAAGLSLLLLVSSWSLLEYWQNPLYQSDDHRQAVADLAAAWRPGDAILVNAGWVYPVLEIYWPQKMPGPDGSLPPALAPPTRLVGGMQQSFENPRLLVTGSVDGSPTLGWGMAESDFYAMPAADAQAAIERLAAQQPRIWHYRLYDTASDPNGLIRQILARNGSRLLDLPYPGRDHLRLELYEAPAAVETAVCPQSAAAGPRFGQALHLLGHVAETTASAGRPLYVTLCWQALDGVHLEGREIRASLRLYLYTPTQEVMIAQADAAPLVPTTGWEIGEIYRQPLALPLPASLPPGRYSLEFIAYTAGDGMPLEPDHELAIHGQRWPLAQVEVDLPPQPPPTPAPLARFDYIELVSADLDRQVASPGDPMQISLLWRPRPHPYRDTYSAVFVLEGAAVLQMWAKPLGGGHYPSGDWPAEYAVRMWEHLVLPSGLPPGEYRLSVHLERASDGLAIPARIGWRQRPGVEIGRVEIR